jgi:hypothetical protein
MVQPINFITEGRWLHAVTRQQPFAVEMHLIKVNLQYNHVLGTCYYVKLAVLAKIWTVDAPAWLVECQV